MANGWGAAVGGLLLGLTLGAGVTGAGLMVGDSLIGMKRAERAVSVKGLSEQEVEADVASWRIPFRGSAEDRAAAIAAAEASRAAIVAFAEEGGLSAEEISVEPFTVRIERLFLNTAQGQEEKLRYDAVGAVRMRTENVAAVAALSARTQALLDAGVLLGDNDYGEASRPEYLFTQLNEIKPELIAEATRNARASAQQFAEDSGARVGGIASANQGVIQILPRDGQFDERFERSKIVRVVSTVRYYLEE